ncbi:hypothetical protein LIA77_11281 [Sarocladium implicatum]|nr:hypothetical protein LIA77_11281 [Sarocladium implicatum]
MLGFTRRFNQQAQQFANQEYKKMYPIPPSVRPSPASNRPVNFSKQPSASQKTSRSSVSAKSKRPAPSSPPPATPVRLMTSSTQAIATPSPVPSLSSSASSPMSARNPKTPMLPTSAVPSKRFKVVKASKVARYIGPPVRIDLTGPEPHECQADGGTSIKAPAPERNTRAKLTPSLMSKRRHPEPEACVEPGTLADRQRRKRDISNQLLGARFLAQHGDQGPFEIGDYLCEFEKGTGKVLRRANRRFHAPTGRYLWINLSTQRPYANVSVVQQYTEVYGTPIANPDGSLSKFDKMEPGSRITRSPRPSLRPMRHSWDPMLTD